MDHEFSHTSADVQTVVSEPALRSSVRMAFGIRMWLADAALLACAFLWGLGFVAMKSGLSVYPTWWLLFLRFGGGTLLMLFFFHKRIRRASGGDLLGGAVIGLFLFLGMGLQTLGLNYTAAGRQAFLTAGYVVLVPLLLWGLRRLFPGWLTLAAALVCFIGMGFLTSDLSGPINRGDILTIASTFMFAGQIISIGHYAARGDPIVLTFVQFLVTAALSVLVGFVSHDPFVWQGTRGLIEVGFATFFATFACFLIQNCAQKFTLPSHAALLLGLESVFGLLGGIFLLGEAFTFRMAVGCLLIFSSVVAVELAPLLRVSGVPAGARGRPSSSSHLERGS